MKNWTHLSHQPLAFSVLTSTCGWQDPTGQLRCKHSHQESSTGRCCWRFHSLYGYEDSAYIDLLLSKVDFEGLASVGMFLYMQLFKNINRDFPGDLVVKTPCFQMQGVQVQSLVRKLRFPHIMLPKKKKNWLKKYKYWKEQWLAYFHGGCQRHRQTTEVLVLPKPLHLVIFILTFIYLTFPLWM